MNKGIWLIKREEEDLIHNLNVKCYEKLFSLCIRATRSLQPIEIITQERNLCYLDLAITSGSGRTWRRYLTDRCIRTHPPITAEYLMTETGVFQASMFNRLYTAISMYHTMQEETFDTENFMDELYMKYETNFFEEINTSDNLQSIEKAVRGMLFIYRIFDVDRFSILYVPLLSMCVTRILNPALTMELLRTLCTSDDCKIQAFVEILDDVCLQNMIRQASEMRFAFWGFWQGNSHLNSEYNPVADSISSSAFSKANILLKYGFPYTADRVEYKCMGFSMKCTRLPGRSNYIYRYLLRLLDKKSHIRLMLIMDTFRAYANFEGTGEASERISNLVYLTRSLPYPYVTPEEMSSELGNIFHPFSTDEFNRTCNAYNDTDVFDKEEGHRVYKPRRLLHLSRCAVRKVMVSNLRLMDDVDELNIPKELKPYLKLEV